MLPLNQKVSAAQNALVQNLEGESIVLNLQTEKYFSLDDIGTRICQVLIEKDSIQTAIDTLFAEYDIEPERLQQDVEKLIEELLKHGLVEVNSA